MEFSRGHDLSDDGVFEGAGIVDELHRGFGKFFLVVIMVEDRRAVLSADVVSLAIEGGGIMGFPEPFEELVV